MRGRNLFILAVTAVVLVIVAALTSLKEKKTAPELVGMKLLPNLQVNDVQKIVMRFAGTTTMVAKVGGIWSAPDRYGYAVRFDKVSDALRGLEDLKVGQVVAVETNELTTLHLLSPADAGAGANAGTLVELFGSNDVCLASMLLGKAHMRQTPGGGQFGAYPDGRYICHEGKVVVVSEVPKDFTDGLDGWLDKQLVNIEPADIMDISVTGKGREPIKLCRKKSGEDLKLDGLREDEELDSTKLYGLSGALRYLDFADVTDPAMTNDVKMGLDNPVVYTARTKERQVYTVKVGGAAGAESNRYVRIGVVLEPSAEKEEPDKAKEKEVKLKKQEELVRKTASLNEKLSKWTYLLSPYKANLLTVNRVDLVRHKEKKEGKKAEKKGKAQKKAKKKKS